MADMNKRYDVAVIDECQMIADEGRGGAWTAAILGLCADEIHICMAPHAEDIVKRLIEYCGDEIVEIDRRERMTPGAGSGQLPFSRHRKARRCIDRILKAQCHQCCRGASGQRH